ncbi:DUF4145 domain-containing protein [Achromobacter piechaudii]|uniref:DUF4145 domain-containing protein n=1 Tax=Achromobacter piechaudii TaxID=72556 RepID=A0A6S7EQG5_9BURK|nr:DUF4145 domain-containing protein [Achromobacter piechaudii]CAB3916246.1 hypothetical protein LMG1861_05099 [Achromobacter piechaudii]
MAVVPPRFELAAFQCPHCAAYAHMTWERLRTNATWYELFVATCKHCGRYSLWQKTGEKEGHMIAPNAVTAPPPHADLPADCVRDYEEAREIAACSPRGAAALLRLVVQKLCVTLGQPGENINNDIRALVQAGLPVDAQQALDVLRVTGNNAVHPGAMDLVGDPRLVAASFDLINIIVDQQISQRKRIANLFATLPDGAKAAIARRDGT